MYILLYAFSKSIQSLILNLKEGYFSSSVKYKLPYMDVPDEFVKSHEELSYALTDLDVPRIRVIGSLDSSVPVTVYGQNADELIEFLRELRSILSKNFTVTRAFVRGNRSIYRDTSFFVSEEGFIIPRSVFFNDFITECKEFIDFYSQIKATPKPTNLMKHNMALVDIVVEDLLNFVKKITYKEHVPSN